MPHNLGSQLMISFGRFAKRGSAQPPRKTPEAALQMMHRGLWAEAAQLWRHLILQNERPEYQVQLGHSLKEAGYFSDARVAYERAVTLAGATADLLTQFGHLSKVAGRFQEAVDWYTKALAAAPDPSTARTAIQREIRDCRVLLDRTSAIPKSDAQLVLSSAGGFTEATTAPPRLGVANYSYSFAMRGFIRAAERLGIGWTYLERPQLWSDAGSVTTAPSPIHLRFSPPHNARLLKGAKNILCFAWEFPTLPIESDWAHAFSDPRHMLDLFEEVWVPSQYSATAVAQYTTRPVRVVSSPIQGRPVANPQRARSSLGRIQWVPLSIFPRLQANFNAFAAARSKVLEEVVALLDTDREKTVFLTVVNPHDKRKQLAPMLRGFAAFAATNPNAILLIKAASPDDNNQSINNRLLTSQIAIANELVEPLYSERIWITTATLTDREMDALYSAANFYLCTSYCEGQNLPLLEAMARGVVPVSPQHTAMADYIHPENAVIVSHSERSAPVPLQQIYRIWGQDINVVDQSSVVRALQEAVSLDETAYSLKSRSASHLVRDRYGPQSLAPILMDCGLTNLSE